MNLKQKVVVITGASRGLGASLARVFARVGAQVVVGARATEELKKLAADIGGYAVLTNVTSEAEVGHLAEEAVQKYGRVDVWVNNAGIRIPRAPVEEMDVGRVRKMMDVNFFGTLFGTKAALRYMRKQGGGTIINILSTSALEGVKHSTGYGASKGAAIAFTKSLRIELEPFDIKVIGVYPPGMRTHFFDEKKPDDYATYADPDDVAAAIVKNLISDVPENDFFVKKQPRR